jgi:hypothetical protein
MMRAALLRRLSDSAIWIPVVVIALLVMPMIVTKRSFGHDWTLHLWLIREQQLNINAMSHPDLFVSVTRFGVFYPLFVYTGSGLYAVGGYLAILLGNRPVVAYKLLYVAGFVTAYGGMTWLSAQLGLRNWRAQAPGLVLVTGTYFITDFVGRGDLGEFIALAVIPMLIAACRSVFTQPRTRARDLIALVTAAFFFTGSHNITLLWGSIFIAFLTIVCFVAFAPAGLPRLQWTRLSAVASSLAIGTGLNAWFLVPDLRYGLDTLIARSNENRVPRTVLTKPGLLLNPLRPADPATLPFGRDLRVSLPWMFALWALVVAVFLWRARDGSSRRAFAGVFGVSLVYLTLVCWQGAWVHAPHVLYNLQFPWRLNAYILLCTALLVILALRWQATSATRVNRCTSIVLIAFMLFNVGAATWQVWRVRSEYVRGPFEVVTGSRFLGQVVASRYDPPVSWYAKGAFFDVSTPVIATESSRVLTVPVTAVHGSKFKGVLPVPDGPLPFSTNISAGQHFVRMTGISPVGRTRDGSIVAIRRPGVQAAGPIEVTITPFESTAILAGAVISIISALLLLGILGWALSRVIRRRCGGST